MKLPSLSSQLDGQSEEWSNKNKYFLDWNSSLHWLVNAEQILFKHPKKKSSIAEDLLDFNFIPQSRFPLQSKEILHFSNAALEASNESSSHFGLPFRQPFIKSWMEE